MEDKILQFSFSLKFILYQNIVKKLSLIQNLYLITKKC